MAQTQSRVLGVEQAGRMLGLGRSAAYEAVRRGEIPTLRLGRRLVVPRARLAALLGEAVEVVTADATDDATDDG